MSRIPWLWNLLSQYWLEIETSFCFSGPLELVNFRLKSLLETTFAQSKQICSFDDGDTHTRSIDLVGVESAHSATEVIACVAWRFWLGALSNKGGRGQRNREEIGAGATEEKNEVKGAAVKNPSNPGRRFFFFSRLRRSSARAPGSSKPPCYAGYWSQGLANETRNPKCESRHSPSLARNANENPSSEKSRPLATSSLAVGRFAAKQGLLRSPRGRLVAILTGDL